MTTYVCGHDGVSGGDCEICDAAADERDDRAVLAIAPDVLKLTDKGRAALAEQGMDYLSEQERELLYGIVMTVERILICEVNK